MANIFISYSSDDKSIVQQLAALLESKGWSVWWDRQIPIGQSYDTVIEEELNKADCVLVIWTKRSVASNYVKNEANEALSKNKLIPILLEQVTPPLAFRLIESALLIDWKGYQNHPELELLFGSIHKKISGENSRVDPLPVENPILKFLKKCRSPIIAGLCILLASFLAYYFIIRPRQVSNNVTIRVFDWKKKPVTKGEVKIYLKEYIRTQSIDNMGQALFNGIPGDMFSNPMKIEITSPGYTMKSFDTLLRDTRQLELTLPLTAVVFISGKIKTASENPIKNVEVNVDGTKYFDKSKTDGSYKIRLEEYTLGDEISITTSHEGYEDKTISITINTPDITNQDIFLQPVHP